MRLRSSFFMPYSFEILNGFPKIKLSVGDLIITDWGIISTYNSVKKYQIIL